MDPHSTSSSVRSSRAGREEEDWEDAIEEEDWEDESEDDNGAGNEDRKLRFPRIPVKYQTRRSNLTQALSATGGASNGASVLSIPDLRRKFIEKELPEDIRVQITKHRDSFKLHRGVIHQRRKDAGKRSSAVFLIKDLKLSF